MYRKASQVYVSQFGYKLFTRGFFKIHKLSTNENNISVSVSKSSTSVYSLLILWEFSALPPPEAAAYTQASGVLTEERSHPNRRSIWFIRVRRVAMMRWGAMEIPMDVLRCAGVRGRHLALFMKESSEGKRPGVTNEGMMLSIFFLSLGPTFFNCTFTHTWPKCVFQLASVVALCSYPPFGVNFCC